MAGIFASVLAVGSQLRLCTILSGQSVLFVLPSGCRSIDILSVAIFRVIAFKDRYQKRGAYWRRFKCLFSGEISIDIEGNTAAVFQSVKWVAAAAVPNIHKMKTTSSGQLVAISSKF